MNLWHSFKVKEYWLVHPEDKYAMVFKLDLKTNGAAHDIYLQKVKVKVGIFKDFIINLETAYDEALKQLAVKEYNRELKATGVNRIIEIALAFESKKVMMRHGVAE